MREFARCLAWALAAGAAALAFAMFGGAGLQHADGPLAWLSLAVFAPYYALVHATGHRPDVPFLIAVFIAQFAWFLAIVALVRLAARGKPRWRARGARE